MRQRGEPVANAAAGELSHMRQTGGAWCPCLRRSSATGPIFREEMVACARQLVGGSGWSTGGKDAEEGFGGGHRSDCYRGRKNAFLEVLYVTRDRAVFI